MLELGEEEKKKVEAELAEFGPVVPTSSGLLPLETYIKAQKVITKLTFNLRNETESTHANERRELLKQAKEEEYNKCIAERQQSVRAKATGFTLHVLRTLHI